MIRTLLADDHELFLEGMRELLEKSYEVEIVGSACDGLIVLEQVASLRPDVVLMDVTMPKMNGIQATLQISRDFPETSVLALSMHGDLRFIAEMLKAGARGYILKECTSQELISAITIVARGEIYLSPGACTVLVDDYLRLAASGGELTNSPLSEREIEVLKLLVQGRNGKQIADALSISKNTVDSHRRHIMDKLGCGSVADLTRYAIREGLLDLT